MQKLKKIGWKVWLVIWLAGMAGQLAWNIENQWFNTFVYAKIAPLPSIITWMVAISACVSTFATFLMGTISDRVGKRRQFILLGYIMWGGIHDYIRSTQFSVGTLGVTGAAILVVVADAVMSFFGSTGNDSAFNAWTTDISTPSNRGNIDSALAIQPVIATILGTVVFGAILGMFENLIVAGQSLDYFMLFLIVGIVVIIIGVVSFFLSKESPTLIPSRDEKISKQLAKPFNFKLMKNNRLLPYVLLIFAIFFIFFNIYFSHILNYFLYGSAKEVTEWLSTSIFGNSSSNSELVAGALFAVGLCLGIPFVIMSGRLFLNKLKFTPVLFISVGLNAIGLLIMFFGGLVGLKEGAALAYILIGIFFIGVGYMAIYQALMVWIKSLYPENMRSQFEGVRMIFNVCIPMFLGSLIGNVIVEHMGIEITLSYPSGNVTGWAPSYWIFFIAFFVEILTFIPVILAEKEIKKNPPIYQED